MTHAPAEMVVEYDAARSPTRGPLASLKLGGMALLTPAILVADLDPGLTREEAMSLDVAGHYSRPDVFAFGVNPSRPGVPARSPE